jgi:presequence protease
MAFEIKKQVTIGELDCVLTQLRHVGSGARVLHIGNDDPENLFCLAFQTVPSSSDGAPHILEHTVLCGSEKYPVKDPFFGMIRRSLNTFMNAMTGDDMTFYPAASQVEKDFYNLLDVYVDAVFFPFLKEESFKQERKIVFNEMKGALASAEARGWHKLAETLYPNTPYRFNSGGDPKEIPGLTWEGLKAFHREHYAPSRCLFYFYGNLPLEKHLEYLEERLLGAAPKLEPLPSIPHQKRWTAPVRVADTYPVEKEEPTEERTNVLMAWLCTTPIEQLEVLELAVLDLVLTGSDASPLKLTLLKSGLCKEAYAFVDPESTDVPFIMMMRGCPEKAVDGLEKLVLQTLKTIATGGLPPSQLEAAIHQLEFSRTEILGDSGPFGLTLFRRTAPLLFHGGDAEEGLHIHQLFDELQRRFSDPNYLGSCIRKFLLDNTHWCRLAMSPDPERAARDEAEWIAPEGAEGGEGEEDDPNVLPKVTLDDVSSEAREFPLEIDKRSGLTVYSHPCFTNQVVDASLVFDLSAVAPDDLPYVRLLTSVLPEVGCGGRSYAETLDRMQLYTADVGAGLGLHPQADNPDLLRPVMAIDGKALRRNMDHLFPLLADIATSPDLQDRARMEELLMQHLSSLENGLIHNAMRYAVNQAGRGLSPLGHIYSQWYGLDYLQTIRAAAKDLDGTIERLVSLADQLLGIENAELVLGCDGEMKGEILNMLPNLPDKPHRPFEVPMVIPAHSEGRIIASPVAFTARVLRTVPYTHPDSPALDIAARLFEHRTLHKAIREEGGAYGANARFNPATGSFTFTCYRDPHLASSLEAMDRAVAGIVAGDFDAANLEEAKLTVLQKLDTPISPGSRASVAWARQREGRTPEVRQAYRDRLLTLDGAAISAAVEKHILPKMKEATVVAFAGRELFEREKSSLEILPV